jgi:hypothetical protein
MARVPQAAADVQHRPGARRVSRPSLVARCRCEAEVSHRCGEVGRRRTLPAVPRIAVAVLLGAVVDLLGADGDGDPYPLGIRPCGIDLDTLEVGLTGDRVSRAWLLQG